MRFVFNERFGIYFLIKKWQDEILGMGCIDPVIESGADAIKVQNEGAYACDGGRVSDEGRTTRIVEAGPTGSSSPSTFTIAPPAVSHSTDAKPYLDRY
jgi:hypothetical protein